MIDETLHDRLAWMIDHVTVIAHGEHPMNEYQEIAHAFAPAGSSLATFAATGVPTRAAYSELAPLMKLDGGWSNGPRHDALYKLYRHISAELFDRDNT
jgi:hypothetical protein